MQVPQRHRYYEGAPTPVTRPAAFVIFMPWYHLCACYLLHCRGQARRSHGHGVYHRDPARKLRWKQQVLPSSRKTTVRARPAQRTPSGPLAPRLNGTRNIAHYQHNVRGS